jgi:hypothetical protein
LDYHGTRRFVDGSEAIALEDDSTMELIRLVMFKVNVLLLMRVRPRATRSSKLMHGCMGVNDFF